MNLSTTENLLASYLKDEAADFENSLPSIQTAIPGPKSLEYADRLKLVESPGLTYLSAEFPVFWEKSSEANIWDVDGNRFLDLNSAFGVSGIGHSNSKVADAVSKQALQLIHGMGDVHPPRIKVEFMEKLKNILPSPLSQMILSCNGSDACESALKTAQVYTGKPGVIAFNYGYHGLGYGALDMTHKPHFRSRFTERLTPHTFHAPFPNPYRNGDNALEISLNAVREIISSQKDKLGAIIVEPIQGRGGVVVPPDGFLKGLREICDQNNLLLILDEIYTGFGRTGKMFAFEYEDIIPDILCLGKTIGGGLPLSICVSSPKIMQAWGLSNGEAIHTSTFLGNPLACAAGVVVLNDLRENSWPEKNEKLGEYILNQLQEKIESNQYVGDIRGKGLMIGIELVKDKTNKEPYTDLANYVLNEALRRGLIVLSSGTNGHVLSLSPPFVISHKQIDFAINTLADILINSAID
jgi:4-aminobutyrate aminotransferase/(S)-3-amino-2-methylpropionate transaminase